MEIALLILSMLVFSIWIYNVESDRASNIHPLPVPVRSSKKRREHVLKGDQW